METHPTADISPGARIGAGTRIWAYAQVREGASVGANCVLGRNVYLDPLVVVGNNCKLENGVNIFRPAVLEDGVFLGPGVILTNDRLPRAVTPEGMLKGDDDWHALPVVVRTGAAVGAGAVVLPGVTIGEWAMVGAGAVVREDVEPHALVVGNPARPIGWVCRCGGRLPGGETGPPPSETCPACAELAATRG